MLVPESVSISLLVLSASSFYYPGTFWIIHLKDVFYNGALCVCVSFTAINFMFAFQIHLQSVFKFAACPYLSSPL